jgi:hypothetical protein
MAKSIRQIQDEIINDGFLDSLAKDGQNYQELKQYPVLKKMILLASDNFIITALEELERQGKVNTGGLADGLSSTDVIEKTEGYEVELGYDPSDPSAKYYDFVNKGVGGVKSGGSSKYRFKSLYPSKKMVSAIEMWMRQRGLQGRADDQRYNLTANQRKNKGLAQKPENKLRSFAYATAKKIKREGIPYSGFFDKAIEAQFGDEFSNAVASTVAADLRVYIRKLDLLINKETSSEN